MGIEDRMNIRSLGKIRKTSCSVHTNFCRHAIVVDIPSMHENAVYEAQMGYTPSSAKKFSDVSKGDRFYIS